ncbi:MAG: GT4 family glycosyltransferase PelF [Mariprofundaceae bacterium]
MSVYFSSDKMADVTLLLEGTYPFIYGGVSNWVHQIICGLPEFSFALVFVGSSSDQYEGMKYELPENILHLEVHYLMEKSTDQKEVTAKARPGHPEAFKTMGAMHQCFRDKKFPDSEKLTEMLSVLGKSEGGVSHEDFLYSEEAWQYILNGYREHSTDPSFIDYFWTIRTMHAPIFLLDNIARNVPKSRLLHTISTGYAGFLGALIALRTKRKLLISEHGIYTKERKIDLYQADWIMDHPDVFAGGGINSDICYLRHLWVHFFEGLGRVAYEASDQIVALYEGNRLRQLDNGAEDLKTRVIPNGIKVERFLEARAMRQVEIPMVVGLVGRVVPIKDIKTFIRAMYIVCDKIEEAEGWIIGPYNEDPEYADECKSLVKNMGLEEKVRFLGMQKVEDIFPKIGLNVLTSISEALPLVILEGYASGVPTVATEVGACHELIYGSAAKDKALGASGKVVPIANPDATAEAIVSLLKNPEAWSKAQQAGIRRVESFYTEDMLFDAYQDLYQRLVDK